MCRDTGLTVVCDCDTGYVLAPDGRTCLDVNECEEESHACSAELRCENTRGGYQCVLRANSRGFRGRASGLGGVGGSTMGGGAGGGAGAASTWNPGTFWGDRRGGEFRQQPCPKGFKLNVDTQVKM